MTPIRWAIKQQVSVKMWRNWNSYTFLVSLIFVLSWERDILDTQFWLDLPAQPSALLEILFRWLLAFMIADEKVAASLIVVPLIDKLLFLFGCCCCYYYDYDDDDHPSFMSFSFTMKCLDVYYFYFYNYLGFLLLFLRVDCFFILSGTFISQYLYHTTSLPFSLFFASGLKYSICLTFSLCLPNPFMFSILLSLWAAFWIASSIYFPA